MSGRRLALGVSALLWLGMMGTLGYRQHMLRKESAGDAYTLALFSKDAPVLVSKSVWLREELGGSEKLIGFLETQLTQIGSHDVHVRHELNLDPKKMPASARIMVAGLLSQVLGTDFRLEEVTGQLDVYANRLRGLRRIKGRAQYGPSKLEFVGEPVGGKYLRVTTWAGGEESTRLLDYDRRLPFGSGGSPFRNMGELVEGASWTVAFFDPFTRTTVERLIRVGGREKTRHRSRPVDCHVLTCHPVQPGGGVAGDGTYGTPTSRAWVAAEGERRGQVLREEAPWMMFRLAMVLEDSVTAEQRDYHRRLGQPIELRERGGPGAGPESAAPAAGEGRRR